MTNSTLVPKRPRKRLGLEWARAGAAPVVDRKKRLQHAAQTLKQVADAKRLNMVLLLAEGEHHLGAICSILGYSLAAASHHLTFLRVGGVVETRRAGQNTIYSLTELGRSLAEVAQAIA